MLSKEQIKQIKKQILKQIEKFPPEQREAAKAQIEAMNAEQLEELLIKNKLSPQVETDESSDNQNRAIPQQTQCVFCSIIGGQIKTYEIARNSTSIAILEINPISKGHTVIIPKKHVSKDKIPTGSFSLAKKVAKILKSKLKEKKIKDIEIMPAELFGHAIINVFPVYENENINSERKRAEDKELEELQSILKEKKVVKIKTQKKRTKSAEEEYIKKLPKAPERIP